MSAIVFAFAFGTLVHFGYGSASMSVTMTPSATAPAETQGKLAKAEIIRLTKTTLCAAKPDLSMFETRLTFHRNMLEARLAALKVENPKLLAFYKATTCAAGSIKRGPRALG